MKSDKRVADITLERYRLKELPAPAAARLEQRLREDADLRRRLALLNEGDAELRAGGRLELVDAEVRRALTATGATAPRPVWLGARFAVPAAVAAAAVVLLFVFPLIPSFTAGDTERIKGLQPSLTLYRRVGGGSETLAAGAVARAGDVIRIGYGAAVRAYGVILSIDGRGQVTVHLPAGGDQAAPLGREATVLLDQAFELDDAPRFEEFYFVTSNQPFAVAPVVAAARRAATSGRTTAAPLPLSAGLEQTVASLLKESQP
jgi:hypothetical protein